VLELVHGLLEPVEATIFLLDEERGELRPFAQYAEGKFLGEDKVLTRTIPEFSLSEFESHSVICRVHGQEMHAVIPLKVEEQIPGVLFMIWPTDARPAPVQVAEFNRTRRRILLEITHHISLAVKTKFLQTKAVVDGLTRLYSRSHFMTQMVARRIRDVLRKYDSAYRYGGEEIAIILPKTNMQQALGIAERLRRTIEQRKFRGPSNRLIDATISVGVAQYRPDDDPDSLFKRADQQLYKAKESGRNRVCPAGA